MSHANTISEEIKRQRAARKASTQMLREMKRFLVIIERCEDMGEFWDFITSGTGIATANAYRAAIEAAEGKESK